MKRYLHLFRGVSKRLRWVHFQKYAPCQITQESACNTSKQAAVAALSLIVVVGWRGRRVDGISIVDHTRVQHNVAVHLEYETAVGDPGCVERNGLP